MKKVIFQLEQLTCPSCIKKIEKGVGRVQGVHDVQVLFNASKVKVSIESQEDVEKVENTIIQLGYPVKGRK